MSRWRPSSWACPSRSKAKQPPCNLSPPGVSPIILPPKHPILRGVGRSALAIAQDEHRADVTAWREHVGDLQVRATAANVPTDLAADLKALVQATADLDVADPLTVDLEAIRHLYRGLLKRTVGWEIRDSWQSPAMAVSGHPQAAAHQLPVVPFHNDYQRYAIPMAAAEAALNGLHTIGSGPAPASYLFSSGMGAFATLLHALTAEGPAIRLIGSHLYFECARLLTGLSPHAVTVDEGDPAGVVAAIGVHQPDQVFVDPVANSSRMPTVPIAAVWAALATLPGDRIRSLIVDTTMLGPAFQPTEWLHDVAWPAHMRLIAYRSLQKLDQLGLDLVTGGAITVWARHPLALASYRQLCGTHPTEEALRLLPFPDRTALLAKLGRHERNVATFATWLGGLKTPWLGTVHVAEARKLAGHVGPLFWIDWPDGLEAADAQRFCHHLVRTAAAMAVPMAYGTSFGFPTMRVAAFTRSDGHGSALRIAPGTENLARLARLADVWTETLTTFGQTLADAWRHDPASRLSRLCLRAERLMETEALTQERCRELALLLQALLAPVVACGLAPELQALRSDVRQRITQPLAARLGQLVPDPDPARRPDLAALQGLTDALAALEDAVTPKRRWPWG